MGDPIRTLTDDPIPPAPGGSLTCEFCGCSITHAKGEVLKMSERARELRRVEDALVDEKNRHTSTLAQLAAVQTRVIELEQALVAATAPPAPAGNGRWGYSGE